MNESSKMVNLRAWGNPEGDKVVVYIRESAYDAIYRYAIANLQQETGGILLGNISQDTSGRYLVDIVGVAEAGLTWASPSGMQFTGEVWQRLVQSAYRDYPNQKVVGWYHTHPGLGVFMSADDVDSHRVAFSNPWHVAAVCDPVRNEFGFFAWYGTQIRPLSGFYTYEIAAERPVLPTQREPAMIAKAKKTELIVPIVIAVCGLLAALGILTSVIGNRVALGGYPEQVLAANNTADREVYLYFIMGDGSISRLMLPLERGRVKLEKAGNWSDALSANATEKSFSVSAGTDNTSNIDYFEIEYRDQEGIWRRGAPITSDPELKFGDIELWFSFNVSPSSLELSDDGTLKTLQITMSGAGSPQKWSATAQPGGDWLKLDPSDGTGNSTVAVTFYQSGLPDDTREGKIAVTSNNITKSVEVSLRRSFEISEIKDDNNDNTISPGGENVTVELKSNTPAQRNIKVICSSNSTEWRVDQPSQRVEIKPGSIKKIIFVVTPPEVQVGVKLIFEIRDPITSFLYDTQEKAFD